MKRNFLTSMGLVRQSFLILALSCLSFAPGIVNTVYAASESNPEACGQLLADAEARFLASLAPDGSVPASPETQEAALEYIRVSKICYEEIEAQNADALQEETPTFIDDGGVLLDGGERADFVLAGNKWGSSTQGTTGGTVSYSFMGNGISFSAEGAGNSVAISSLSGFQACFITEIQNAFAAWQAVANIRFVQVTDSSTAFNSSNASGDIRIGAHSFDGPSGTLAHAYYPPPNGTSASGDMHFDSAESWSCNTSGIDIGVVALHEIGHSLGLAHENTSTVAVMDPFYNTSLTGLQSDDIGGATTLYGPAALLSPPSNDNFASAKTVGLPFSESISVLDATVQAGEPTVNSLCDGKLLRTGTNTVWYKYTPGVSGLQSLDTLGSSYDTYIAVWTGNAITNLSLVGCDDDNESGLTSQLSLNVTAGIPYYIQVAKYNGRQNSGDSEPSCGSPALPTCNLVFNIKRQIFADVPPSHPYFQYIEALYTNGLTGGCGTSPLIFCPSTSMNRAQSAVFMVRGMLGAGYIPSPPVHKLGDNWSLGAWAEPWAEAIIDEELSTGCSTSPLLYCPWVLLPREQVVIFGLKIKYGVNYQPPPATGTLFADMTNPNHYSTKWAEKAYLDGLMPACGVSGGKPLFCPAAIVDRGLGAFVVAKAKGLVP